MKNKIVTTTVRSSLSLPLFQRAAFLVVVELVVGAVVLVVVVDFGLLRFSLPRRGSSLDGLLPVPLLLANQASFEIGPDWLASSVPLRTTRTFEWASVTIV